MNKMIQVEVAYAGLHEQQLFTLQIQEGSTLEQAILCSGLLKMFPEIDLTKQKIGVFSQIRQLQDIAQDGDRIEIYRPLYIDPKERRRMKAKK